MKKSLLSMVLFLSLIGSREQVTQIKANKSLTAIAALNARLTLFESAIDSSIWVSDGTAGGTVQLSDTIKIVGSGTLLNGKYIFKGISPGCGKEIYICDGTAAGTTLIKDINPGVANSQPLATTMAVLNNHVYFVAVTPAEGCELWKTDGTAANTVLVKDIVTGVTSGIDTSAFAMGSTGSVLLFDAHTAAEGNELWSSTGTAAGTTLLKDIDAGTPSSNPRAFFPFAGKELFTVTSSDGLTMQIWITDGTSGGTVLIKENVMSPFGFVANFVFSLYHVYNNRAYFLIDDGVHSGDALWNTDGIDSTSTHTTFVKDLGQKSGSSTFLITDAVNLPSKFIFPFSDGSTFFSLWQSDGTASGTSVFKDFPVNANGNIPVIYLNGFSNSLYNGKFFFSASDANGNELWTSDGTTAQLLKDIYAGPNDGITLSPSWLFTSSGLFFSADDGTHGNELWKTDGITTTLVKDIFLNEHNADPTLFLVNNGKIFFSATDNSPSDSSVTDLFVVDGTFSPLPVRLIGFTVLARGVDALVQWTTGVEDNVKNFTVEGSWDAVRWENLGIVPAMGNAVLPNRYSFTDYGVMASGKSEKYYRLVSTDLDGKDYESNVIALKIGAIHQWNVSLVSNPVIGRLAFNVEGASGNTLFEIFDINSQSIYRIRIARPAGLTVLPIDLPAGVYVLRVEQDGQSKSIRFVKE